MTAQRLVADIGGTNARFALVGQDGLPEAEQGLKVADHAGLVEAARVYLEGRPVREAVIAVATPVEGDRVKLTNAHWEFSIEAARDALGLERLAVINDLAAQAVAVPRLAAEDLRQLGGGSALPDRPIAVIGPGTGLGMALLMPAKGAWRAWPTEGGHTSFAPADDLEAELLAVLRRRFGHVSVERLLSGPGLVNLAQALAEVAGDSIEIAAPAAVEARAADGSCAHCAAAVRLFSAILGSVAGDLALTVLARGGVYVTGGLCSHLGDLFDAALFHERFVAKGRFEALLRQVPCFLVLRARIGLLGAAVYDIGEA